jgi:hypothetical protein
MSAVKFSEVDPNRWFVRSGGGNGCVAIRSRLENLVVFVSRSGCAADSNSSSRCSKVIFPQWQLLGAGHVAASTRSVKECPMGFRRNNALKGGPLTRVSVPGWRWIVWRYPGVSCRSDIVARRFRIPEQDRVLRTLANNQVNLRSYRLVFPIAFETEKWPRWLHRSHRLRLVCSAKQSKALRRSSQNVLSRTVKLFLV